MVSNSIRLVLLFCLIFSILLLINYMDSQQLGDSYSERLVVSPKETRRFREVFVHLDLKGAPPKVGYILEFFKLLAEHHVDGVLIEYENMFPYDGNIMEITRDVHYTKEEIRLINEAAGVLKLEVIPLIQTFGHLEFVLKQEKFSALSENPFERNTICVSEEKAILVVETMIQQIRNLHPNSTRIHIGADEAYHIAEDRRCFERMEAQKIGKSALKLKHIARIGEIAKRAGFTTVFAWNDMFDKEGESEIWNSRIDKFILPVVWGYASDVNKPGYFPDGLFDRIYNVFSSFYVASAFKGANGINQTFSNVSRYVENHKSYAELADLHAKPATKLAGIFVTGWSRFSHAAPLCELLPVAIPSLVADLQFINYGLRQTGEIWQRMRESLRCREGLTGVLAEWALDGCQFPGVHVFELIMKQWKQIIDRKRSANLSVGVELRSEAIATLNKLRTALEPIYYEKDVNEICVQYLDEFDNV